ncbi:hypothetical protein ASPWEDRAFT_127273 [Aspergillus wentii DTO 134E9]|uniref:DUF7730 domain-containing protein n=1 Tax=Aspergillus wentii DTO 134E9 TaxID=1073089 RepID=A0A1L9RUT6_ASPWE|nr:uncharacterized protein ASPWEDRAFT_127273 [Aspergillus wentii DTO 134E9]KAI9928553.1 hypothetical protein MW887_001767 [Aspergillus wentii]OJJ38627.1 hypothetical protein ASPWEDRAFT_127273 [Aspergillus wentii DTO 134E9]
MRHFDAWLLRDPYSIWHYYSTGRRWQETVRDLIQDRKICAPPVQLPPPSNPIDPYARPINPQDESMLLRHLPPEVRLIIYNYVFGDEAVHLVQIKDKIRHVRCCHSASSLDSNRHCCPATPARWRIADHTTDRMLYPHTHAALPELLSNSSLALLRTCRGIYVEAADLPYSNPVFDVDDLHTFIAFSLSISPDHLRAIKRLTVQWMPIWQPMAGEEHKSSIFSHTHNDRLWALFWTRVAALDGLEELRLSLDLGRFSGNTIGGLIDGKKRLRLAIDEPWVRPLLGVRGLHSFDLGITARCDAYAKGLLEDNLRRDAASLRDNLRAILCSSPGDAVPIPGLRLSMPCSMEIEDQPDRKVRPRLAITAA